MSLGLSALAEAPISTLRSASTDLFTWVGQASGFTPTGSTTVSATIPAATQTNDTVLVFVHEGGSASQTYTNNLSYGTPTYQDFQASANGAVWVVPAGASDAGSTLTITSTRTGFKTLEVLVLRGRASVDAEADTLSPSNGVDVIAPAVTKTLNYDALVTFHGIATANARTWTQPVGFVPGPTTDTGANVAGSATACFYRLNSGLAGSTGTITATSSTTTNVWIAFTIALKVYVPPATGYIGWGIHL